MSGKSKFDIGMFINVARKYNLRYENSMAIKAPNNTCWLDISKELEYAITAEYAYTIVKANIYGVADELFLNKTSELENYKDIIPDIIDDQKNISYSSSEITESNDETLHFNITLTYVEWNSIYNSMSRVYKHSADEKIDYSTYLSLKLYDCKSVIRKYFFEQTKLTCLMVYKHAKFDLTEKIFLSILAYCSNCKSILKGILNNCPKENSSVIISCTITGAYKNCKKYKKKRVIREKKEEYNKQMKVQNMSTAFIQHTKAEHIIDYGDNEPSYIPSLNALRFIKHKPLTINENTLVLVSLLNETPSCTDVIGEIEFYKLFMHYRFAAGHMLSEKHNNISYWLTEWLRTIKTPPKLIVTDQSLALMNAIFKSFIQFSSLNVYLSNCSNLIMKEPVVDIPLCMIRNDLYHITHLESSLVELNSSSNYSVDNFYMNAIGLLVISDTYKDILKLICTVALNETDRLNNIQEPTQCEIVQNDHKQIIATHRIEFEAEAHNKIVLRQYYSDENEEILNDMSVDKQLYLYCEKSSKLVNTTGDQDNMHYSRSLVTRFLLFCKSIIMPIFGYDDTTEISATLEKIFQDFKTVFFKCLKFTSRLDDLFLTFVNLLIDQMNLLGPIHISCQKPIVKKKPKTKKIISQQTQAQINDKIYANWKNQLIKQCIDKDPTIPQYPTVCHYDNSKTNSSVLLNGNVAELKCIKLDNLIISVTNTCAFDSFAHIWLCAYVDSSVYAEYVNKNLENEFMTLVSNAAVDGITENTYRERIILLKDIFNDNDLSKTQLDLYIEFNTACTGQFIIKKLFSKCPSITATMACSCSNTLSRQETIVTVNLPTDDLSSFQNIMENYYFDPITCENCKLNMKQTLDFKDHLIIEPVVPFTEQRKLKNHLDLIIQLKDVPTDLKVHNEIYYLRGLVNFIPPSLAIINAVGHYIAYCYREGNDTWEKYDDFNPIVRRVSQMTEIKNGQYIIYTK